MVLKVKLLKLLEESINETKILEERWFNPGKNNFE